MVDPDFEESYPQRRRYSYHSRGRSPRFFNPISYLRRTKKMFNVTLITFLHKKGCREQKRKPRYSPLWNLANRSIKNERIAELLGLSYSLVRHVVNSAKLQTGCVHQQCLDLMPMTTLWWLVAKPYLRSSRWSVLITRYLMQSGGVLSIILALSCNCGWSSSLPVATIFTEFLGGDTMLMLRLSLLLVVFVDVMGQGLILPNWCAPAVHGRHSEFFSCFDFHRHVVAAGRRKSSW